MTYEDSRKLNFLLMLVLVVLAIGIGVALSYVDPDSTSTFGTGEINESENFQVTIQTGRLPGAEDLPTNTSGTGFLYTINTSIVTDMDGLGSIMMENTTGNPCNLYMKFVLDDENKVIYTSPTLTPGTYFVQDILSSVPEPGTYDVTAVVVAVDPNTGAELAEKTRAVTITVKDKR